MTTKPKIKWKVGSPPTGRYRSFEKRGWPSATIGPDDQPIASITCEDDYTPQRAKGGGHGELTVSIAVWQPREGNTDTFKWRTMKQRYQSLDAAKRAAEDFIIKYPSTWPTQLR